jgi:photosystem II stability/assembly factor-like uncharacterized protein
MRAHPLRWPSAASLALAGFFVALPAPQRQSEPTLGPGLVWRNVGPFRAGRISAVSGAVGQPGVFYAGMPASGVWKTTSAGATWFPVFDSVKAVASIGAVEVALSDPNIIYVGTGDQVTGGVINEGNGVYKSVDAGKSWQHLGLDATKQIPSILVDPRDANLVLVAAQGDRHKISDTRGVFRTTDGGKNWTKTLYMDGKTGIQDLASANDVPAVVFATTVAHYMPPGYLGRTPPVPDTGRTGTALYKSTDEGLTWREITGGGLPRLVGRTSLAVAMNTNAQRVFLIANSGLYRSDDGGTTWRQMAADDERIRNGQGGYSSGVNVDPKNPDVVYTLNTASYKSTDGGQTFTGLKGAPGGDDPQAFWIDPTNGQHMVMGLDQGATVSLDGGATWSPWYNQSTEQLYHLSVDNSFPYWIYTTQQDAGAIRTRGRGNLGAVTPMDWSPVNGWEWGTIVADPLNPNVVYASGNGILKISFPSEQYGNVSPAQDPALKLRTASAQPLVWAPWDKHELLAGFQYLMQTTDGGVHWKKISPEFGMARGADTTVVLNISGADPRAVGAIENISPSTVAAGTIWVSTNSGFIHLTRDHGATWKDVSIPGLPTPARAMIEIDASHHDAGTAYAAIDYHTTGDHTPWLYRTRDFGKTWTKIINGLPTDEPSGSFARVIRADTKKAGLLFVGTESGMRVSFDDGDHWQSLQANLPNTSYRDIAIKDNDLVVATYGRGIWILDDYSALRQMNLAVSAEPAHLFKPGDAVRLRRNVGYNTPFPPEVPHALNPPDGVIVSYALASKPAGEILLDVLDPAGKVVRHLSSAPIAPVAEAARPPHPNFWVATPAPMPAAVGLNRVNWDLRYDAPPAFSRSFEINANPGLTPASPEGPLALPGVYTLRLTVDGRTYSRTVTVANDPRSPATLVELRAQHALMMEICDGLQAAWEANRQAVALLAAVEKVAGASAPADVAAAAATIRAKLDTVTKGADEQHGGGRGATRSPNFVGVSGALVSQLNAQDSGDLAPTPATLAGFGKVCRDLKTVGANWRNIIAKDLSVLNAALAAHGMSAIEAPSVTNVVSRRAAVACS